MVRGCIPLVLLVALVSFQYVGATTCFAATNQAACETAQYQACIWKNTFGPVGDRMACVPGSCLNHQSEYDCNSDTRCRIQNSPEMMYERCVPDCDDTFDMTICKAKPQCDWHSVGVCYASACKRIATADECASTVDSMSGSTCTWNYQRNFCSKEVHVFEPASTEIPSLSECDSFSLSTQCVRQRNLLSIVGNGLIATTANHDGRSFCNAGDTVASNTCMQQVQNVFDVFNVPPASTPTPYTHPRCEKYLPISSTDMNTFTPGVYCAAESRYYADQFGANIVFDGRGDPHARFIILVSRFVLTGRSITLINGARASNIFWIGQTMELNNGQTSGRFLLGLDSSLRSVHHRGQLLTNKVTTQYKDVNIADSSTIEWSQCEVGDWEDVGSCTAACGTNATISQIRHIVVDGSGCPELTRNATCAGPPCQMDCVLSGWSTDNVCSVDCGGGVMHWNRSVLIPAESGGQPCGNLTQQTVCNTQPCPIDCVLSGWSTNDTCSVDCGGGVLHWNRSVLVPVESGGQPCGNLTQQTVCNTQPCPIDCVLSGWSTNDTCSVDCGGGVMHWNRSVLVPAEDGGQPCDSLSQQTACNTQPCPIDCVLSGWSTNDTCSVACGVGTMNQTRTVLIEQQYGGDVCHHLLHRIVPCNMTACDTRPPLDSISDATTTFWTSTMIIVVSVAGGFLFFLVVFHVLRSWCITHHVRERIVAVVKGVAYANV